MEAILKSSFRSGFKSATHHNAVRFDNVLLANAEMNDQLIYHSTTIVNQWGFYST